MKTATKVDPLMMRSWRAFLAIHAGLVDALAREMDEALGLPLNWYEVLLILGEAPGRRLRMHELAESLVLSRSAATRFVERMEKAGLVERVRCTADRRGTWVQRTAAGARLFKKAAPVHLRGIERHFARRLSDADAADLTRIMGKLGELPPGG